MGREGEPGARSPEPGARRLRSPSSLALGPWILAFVFVSAGFAKALNPEPIGDTLTLLTGWLLGAWSASGRLVGALVLGEVLLAAWLVSGWQPRLALAASIVALVVFTASLAALMLIKPTSPCGCGLPAVSGNATIDNGLGIARNLILVIIATVAWPPRVSTGSMYKEI